MRGPAPVCWLAEVLVKGIACDLGLVCVMEAHQRTAYTAALLLDRRQAASGAAITAVAVDPSGQRLFLGLEDGVLEEHAILRAGDGVWASLAARKHAAKKVGPPLPHAAAWCRLRARSQP